MQQDNWDGHRRAEKVSGGVSDSQINDEVPMIAQSKSTIFV